MINPRYLDDDESFQRFRRTREQYLPEEVPQGRCDGLEIYDNIETIFLYDSDAHIFKILEGKSVQYGGFVSKYRYIIPGYPTEIVESDNFLELERILFKIYLDNNYFHESWD